MNKTLILEMNSGGDQTYSAEVRRTTWSNPYADDPETPDDDFEVTEAALALPAGDDDGGVAF